MAGSGRGPARWPRRSAGRRGAAPPPASPGRPAARPRTTGRSSRRRARSAGPPPLTASRASAHASPSDDRRDVAPEALRAHELDRRERRRALDEELHAVALLDRGHGLLLVAPRERPYEREA